MRKIWAIVRREFLERVRTRWFWVGALLGPVLFGVVFFLSGPTLSLAVRALVSSRLLPTPDHSSGGRSRQWLHLRGSDGRLR